MTRQEVEAEVRRLAAIAPACGGKAPEGRAAAAAVARAYTHAAELVRDIAA